jgi:hypothetical protein
MSCKGIAFRIPALYVEARYVSPKVMFNSTAVHSVERSKRKVNILKLHVPKPHFLPDEVWLPASTKQYKAPYWMVPTLIVRLGSCKKRLRSHQACWASSLPDRARQRQLQYNQHNLYVINVHSKSASIITRLLYFFCHPYPDGFWGPPVLVSIQWTPEARLHGHTTVWTKNLAINRYLVPRDDS